MLLQDTIKPFCKDNPIAQEMWPSFQGLGLHYLLMVFQDGFNKVPL